MFYSRLNLVRASAAIIPQKEVEEEHGKQLSNDIVCNLWLFDIHGYVGTVFDNYFVGGAVELKDISNKLKQNLGEHDSDSYLFTWQEKVFSRVSLLYEQNNNLHAFVLKRYDVFHLCTCARICLSTSFIYFIFSGSMKCTQKGIILNLHERNNTRRCVINSSKLKTRNEMRTNNSWTTHPCSQLFNILSKRTER